MQLHDVDYATTDDYRTKTRHGDSTADSRHGDGTAADSHQNGINANCRASFKRTMHQSGVHDDFAVRHQELCEQYSSQQ